MTILLGLDIATTTGWALYEIEHPRNRPQISCGSWKCKPAVKGDHVDTCGKMAAHIIALHKDLRHRGLRIDRVAIEAPLKVRVGAKRVVRDDMWASHTETTQATNAATEFITPALHGAAIGILTAYKIPVVNVMSSTWRKSFIGVGRAPKEIQNKRKWWKDKVREAADLLASDLGFNCPNMDASDAVGVVFWMAAQVRTMAGHEELFAA